jgi:hypothetical protein
VAIQEALAFLGDARHDDAVGRELDALEEVTWESLVQIAARAGFHFTPEELEHAHTLDWTMRWARYGG